MLILQFAIKGKRREWRDLLYVAIAAAVNLMFTGRLSSVGLSTVVVMVLIGRVVYAFNRLFRRRLRRLTGLER